MNTIQIADISNAELQSAAAEMGATTARKIADNRESGDSRVTVYDLIQSNGCTSRVATTNGNCVWAEADADAFDDLIRIEGIDL